MHLRVRFRRPIQVFWGLGLGALMACGTTEVVDSGTDSGEPTTVERPTDLGVNCAGGCTETLCALENEDCEGGFCLWDGNLMTAYCSLACDVSCPDGYSCVEADDNMGSFCFSDPPDCGNGNVEYGEVCDDGNTDAGDWCAPGCDAHTVPPSGGTVTVTFHGGSPITATGDDPVVRAERIQERLYFSANTSGTDFAFGLPPDAGPAPYTTLLEAGLIENVDGNLCSYQGSTLADIRRIDHTPRQVAGSAAFTMFCLSGNCDFGCNSQFDMTVDFDLRWIETEL
ncbi:MAG: hypothetical protein KC912_18890 [Proteobacteria bacterium]|nr:hypothetical protein [Pseudomonadota bacterium]